jgi:type I restriction enzyme S subunit
MRKDWKIVPFGEVCEISGGSQPPKSNFIYEPKEGYIRLVQVRDYRTNKYMTYVPISKAKKFCTKSDIMIGRYGPPIFGIFSGIEGAYNVALMKAIPNEEKLDKEYFRWFLKTDELVRFVEKTSKRAAGQDGVRKERLYAYPIPIPPLSEQKQIVTILDEAFAAIDQAKANIEKNIENAKELFQSKLNDIFSQKGDGWEEKTLEEVCEKTKNIKWQNHPKSEFEYVDLSSVSRETLNVTETTTVNKKNAPSRAKKIINAGDVIFATTRPTLRRATIIDEELSGNLCSTGYTVLRPKENVSSDWIYFYLLTTKFMDRMEFLQRGASYPAVSDIDVKGSKISVPISKVEEKKSILKMNNLQENTNNLIYHFQQKLNNLEDLKKSILQKAFVGELTAKDLVI